jgi:hypothetical protein
MNRMHIPRIRRTTDWVFIGFWSLYILGIFCFAKWLLSIF